MSYIEMTEAEIKNTGSKENQAQEATLSLSSASNSDWILIPDSVQNICVTVIPGGGASAKVQTTTDPIATVKNGSGITAIDWDAGLVSANTTDIFLPITAIRLVQSGAGTSKITMRAQ